MNTYIYIYIYIYIHIYIYIYIYVCIYITRVPRQTVIVYNKFVSAIAYETMSEEIESPDAMEDRSAPTPALYDPLIWNTTPLPDEGVATI